MTVLIGVVEVSRILNVTTQAVAGMRERGVLVPVRTAPYRYALDQVEALRAERAKRVKTGRRAHGIEIVNVGGEK